MSRQAYLVRLQEVIRKLHGVEAQHVESVPVNETFYGETVWDGNVEVFRLVGHPKADTCYAWAYRQGGKTHSTAVLKLPPVESPVTALRAAIAAVTLGKVKEEFALGIKSSAEALKKMSFEEVKAEGQRNSRNVHQNTSRPFGRVDRNRKG